MTEVLDLRAPALEHAMPIFALPHLAPAAIAVWRARMVDEHVSSRMFEALALEMERAGFDAVTAGQARGFAADERKHAVLCGAVVEALGSDACALVPLDAPLPAHPDVSAHEGVLRNVLASYLNESITVAVLGAERLRTPEGALRDLQTGLYHDEVEHARFGWNILSREVPALDAAAKARMGAYLAIAFAEIEEHELAHLPALARPQRGGAALGLCDGREARALFYDTAFHVIVPSLEALGLPARTAWENRAGRRVA